MFFFLASVVETFLTVFLSNNDQHVSKVPITPETLCQDVVEFCREPGEVDCYLVEMWRSSGEFPSPPPPPFLVISKLCVHVLTNQSVLLEMGSEWWRCCNGGGSRRRRSDTSCVTRGLQDGSRVRTRTSLPPLHR